MSVPAHWSDCRRAMAGDARLLEAWKSQFSIPALRHCWEFWADKRQLPPPGPWRTWLMLAGRGFGKTRAGAEWVASGHRFDAAGESASSRLGGYGLVNLFVRRAITREWSVEARWDNVGDRDYQVVQGYRTPGSNVMVTLRWTPSP